MKIKISIWTLLILVALTNSCIDKIDLSPAGSIELPYINGYLTDQVENQVIQLGKLIPFSNERNPPISGAEIYIIDSNETRYDFEEIDNHYVSLVKFAAAEGIEYTLYIEWDGHQFVSTPQKLSVGQSVDSFSFKEDTITIFDEKESKTKEIGGIMLQIEMLNQLNTRKYYKYSINYTYEFQAYRLPEGHPNKICYLTFPTERFRFILHENLVNGYPLDLKFIEFGRAFQYGISIELNQFSMTNEVFEYWEEVKKIGENTGSIFDTPPYTIKGNMVSINSDQHMRGMFAAYSVKSKRLFVTQKDVSFYYPESRNQEECYPPRPFSPPPHCSNCLAAQFVSIKTNKKPNWWPQ